MVGIDWARHLWQLSIDANDLVRARVNEFSIDCDLKDGEPTVAHKARHERSLWEYAGTSARLHYDDIKVVRRDEVHDQLGLAVTLVARLIIVPAITPTQSCKRVCSAAESLGATRAQRGVRNRESSE